MTLAVKLADAIVALSADVESLRGDLNKAKGATDSAAGQIESRTSTMGSLVQGVYHAVGGAIVNFAQNAISSAAGYISDSVGMASDLNETTSKIGVLFGDASQGVLDWSKNAATALGQSQQQALDAAATFATFGKAAGLSGDDLSNFSTDFVALASDLASFNNTTPEQAIEAIGAALRGESEPLRAYGVLLDDATLRQKALELGLISTTKEALTPQQKVLAAQKAIYEQTTAAQGDFARTSGGLANQQRILDAQMTNLQTTIGTALLPVSLSMVSLFNELAQQVLPPVANFLQNTLVPAITTAADTVYNFISAIIDAGISSSEAREALGLFPESLQPVIQALMDAIGWFSNLGSALADLWSAFAESDTFARIKESIGNLGSELAPLGEKFKKLWEAIQPAVSAIGMAIGAVLGGVAVVTINYLASLFDHLADVIGAVVDIITALLTGDLAGVFQGLSDYTVAVFSFWSEFITNTLSDLGVNVDTWLATLKTNWAAAWATVFLAYQRVENLLVAGWDTLRQWVTVTIPGAFTTLKDAAVTKWTEISNAVTSKIKPITDALSNLKTWLETTVTGSFTALRDTINGLTFNNPFGGLMGWLKELKDQLDWLLSHIPLLGDGGSEEEKSKSRNGGGRGRNAMGGISQAAPILAMAGGAASAITVNVYASKIASEIDEYKLAYRIADVIRRSR